MENSGRWACRGLGAGGAGNREGVGARAQLSLAAPARFDSNDVVPITPSGVDKLAEAAARRMTTDGYAFATAFLT